MWLIAKNVLFSPLGKLAMTSAAVAIVLVGTYAYGHYVGYSEGKVEQLKASVEAYKTRDKVDEEVSGLNSVQLCIELGGLRDDCNQLRGVEETTGGKQPGSTGN